MRVTKANVEEYVKDRGLEPVQVDGIPEGFAFKSPDIEIGGKLHVGQYVAFVPLKHWEEKCAAWSPTIEGLLQAYNLISNGK